MRNLVVVLMVGLVIYTIIDVVRSEPAERYGIARFLWVLLIVLLPLIGSVIWLVARHTARSRGAGGNGSGGSGGSGGVRPRPGPSRGGPARPPRPLAPDDDPEFLWRLEQQQRRAHPDHGRPDHGSGDADTEGPASRP